MNKWAPATPTKRMEEVVNHIREQGGIVWGDEQNQEWELEGGTRVRVHKEPVVVGSANGEYTTSAIRFDMVAEEQVTVFLFDPWTQRYLTPAL